MGSLVALGAIVKFLSVGLSHIMMKLSGQEKECSHIQCNPMGNDVI